MASRLRLAAAAALALLPALAACGARSSLDIAEGAPGPGPVSMPKPAPPCEPGAPAVTIAPGQFGSWSMAVDATDVYWADQNNGRVHKVSKLGGEPVVLVKTADPIGVAVDEAYVYFAGADGVGRVPKEGGAPQVLSPTPSSTPALNQPSFIALDDTFAYWTNLDGTVTRAPKDGSAAPVVLVDLAPTPPTQAAPPAPTGIAVGSDRVFVAVDEPAEILSVPKAGGPPTTLATTDGGPWAVALDATTVFWSAGCDIDPCSVVASVPQGGGAPTDLLSGLSNVAGLAVQGDSVYFVAVGDVYFADGGIFKVPKQGGTTVAVANGLTGPGPLALDDACVYWVDEDGVNKIHQ